MVITKTPYRISLFGGGTDHPAWYKENGGEVISFAINKYCYLTSRILPPFFEHRYRIAYSKIETVKTFQEIQHPAVREVIRKFMPHTPLEIHHDGDLPARSGVGSSSAFAVGLINSLSLLQNKILSNYELANEAITLEQIDLKENVGSQDQIACAIGGLNYIQFGGTNQWEISPINADINFQNEITERVVLIYTGLSRMSTDVQANLLVNLMSKKSVMDRTIELARECRELLENSGDLDLIGEMLVESWSLKRKMNSHAITPKLEELWERAKSSGALGGKVLGAGGGGFCMFWVAKEQREHFLRRFNAGIYVPVRISNEGSSCILKSDSA
jgi:D-glycero-alpha-D-manno-heptose-7-phosphate kinase